MTEKQQVKDITITTLPDGGTYATIFYWDEEPLGITAKKFKELNEQGGKKVEIFDINNAAKCVFDRQFKQFVDMNESKFARIGALVVGNLMAEENNRQAGNAADREHFAKDIMAEAEVLLARMKKEGISFGDLQ